MKFGYRNVTKTFEFYFHVVPLSFSLKFEQLLPYQKGKPQTNYITGTLFTSDAVKQKIKELSTLAPLHNPPNLEGIEVAEEIFPSATQVAVFDTAFHQSIPCLP